MKQFFAIFICIATALIFVACTNNSETKSSKTETTQISAQNSGGEKSFASIEDYINAEETQKAIDSIAMRRITNLFTSTNILKL